MPTSSALACKVKTLSGKAMQAILPIEPSSVRSLTASNARATDIQASQARCDGLVLNDPPIVELAAVFDRQAFESRK